MRARGERETDVRLLVDDGERYLTLANELANSLRCDVYLARAARRIRYMHEINRSLATSGRPSRSTGHREPAEWLVVRPLGLPDEVATWFITARGRLRQSNGLVTVPLPDGIAFATKATYRDTAYLATRIMPRRTASPRSRSTPNRAGSRSAGSTTPARCSAASSSPRSSRPAST